MPKRKNHRWEQVITLENCLAAVDEVLKNRHFPAMGSRLHTPNRRDIERIVRHRAKHPPKPGYITWCAEHKDEVARQVQADLANKTWTPRPYRTRVIVDKLRHKERRLKMPCLYDQFIHHAVLRVMIPDLQKRFYRYSCGSIPGAGQRRAVNAAKRFTKARKGAKYAASCDVYHFYDTCSIETVMACLERVYKDRDLLEVNRKILESMGGTLAIGFFPSPWYANLVLDMAVDKPLKDRYGREVKLVRFADDMLMVSGNKRRLHGCVELIQKWLYKWGLRLKRTYQVYRVNRGAAFLSYRFFRRCTLIRKQILFRITSAARKTRNGISPDLARRLCSYKGIMLPANSRPVWKKHFTKNTWKKCRRAISYVDTLCAKTRALYSGATA